MTTNVVPVIRRDVGLSSWLLHPVALLTGCEVNCDVCPLFCLVNPDRAADDHVKIKITKYKTGRSPGGEVKVQEMGEGDPQWQHIKDVVKEQLEKAGLKAEGTRGAVLRTLTAFSLLNLFPPEHLALLCFSFHLVSEVYLSKKEG